VIFMTDGAFPAGQTALIVRIEAAEPLVASWRARLDPSAAAGVPAHVTVLYPFLDISRIDPALLAQLRGLVGRHAAFTCHFRQCRRFSEVLYLAPEPGQPFRALTGDVAARWPEAPPYGGQFDDVIPHLTVVDRRPTAVLDEVEAALAPGLPIAVEVEAVTLLVCDGQRWHSRAEFPLAPRNDRRPA
jgi:2'-5' RNA ligase superfamily